MSEKVTLPDVDAGSLSISPIERAETIPSSWYTDQSFHEADLRHVLRSSWQYIGHAGSVMRPGDYVAETIAGEPVLIVRDREERLRGFYNVCRHRGGPLVMDRCGSASLLQCKYHGWTYRLDGSLRGVPRFDRSDLFDPSDYGLVEIAIAEWEGLIFVNLGDGRPTLLELVDGIAEEIAPIRLKELFFFRRDVYDMACNWKVYVDNYLEGYHLPLVHPELCDVLDVRRYVTESRRYHSLQHSPVRDDTAGYGLGGERAFYYFLFPNMMLNLMPGRLQVNTVCPTEAGRCRVAFDYYYDDVESSEALASIEKDIEFSDKVQLEDVEICERVQLGLQSGGYDRGRFSPEAEQGVYHFQCLLKERYAGVI
jgi:choline monooxygenase